MEVNRLRRQAHTELLQEEMVVKLQAQSQLLSVFDEHNKALQTQVHTPMNTGTHIHVHLLNITTMHIYAYRLPTVMCTPYYQRPLKVKLNGLVSSHHFISLNTRNCLLYFLKTLFCALCTQSCTHSVCLVPVFFLDL